MTESTMMGHNSEATDPRLKLIVERIERLEDEKKGISDDIKDVFAEAKGTGYDPKIIKRVIKLRAMDPDKRREEESLVEIYLAALGMD